MPKPIHLNNSYNKPIRISVFQALTLLAKKYSNDPHSKKYKDIMSLYLSGVKGKDEAVLLADLLSDILLDRYAVSSDKNDINEDPVRRYFESHLCYETLLNTLDKLTRRLLEAHIKLILRLTSEARQNKFKDIINAVPSRPRPNEYVDALYTLGYSDSYQSFMPANENAHAIFLQRKHKISLLVKSIYLASCVPENNILDIYNEDDNSAYSSINRGRISRVESVSGVKQDVHSCTLGIMRSYMPLPQNDVLLAQCPSRLVRPADVSTFSPELSRFSKQLFKTNVTPFVNSISGTMLIKLRVLAQLRRDGNFVFYGYRHRDCYSKGVNNEIENVRNYFKAFIALMVYQFGGHSLYEYLRVFQLPEVLKEFESLPDFSSLTLDNLFKNWNEHAFKQAVIKTISYNEVILGQKKMHNELINFDARLLHKVSIFSSLKQDRHQLDTTAGPDERINNTRAR